MRYTKAVTLLLSFLHECRVRVPSWDDLDTAVGIWLEHIYSEGEHKSLASDALAGLQFFLPQAMGKMKHSWKLTKVWQRLEPPMRVLPASPLLILGFAGTAVALGYVEEAAGLLVAFDCMLRSGELYSLRVQDISFMRGRAVLNLGHSKTGKRTGHSEMVVCESRIAFHWLWQACKTRRREQNLLSRGPVFFRKLFHSLIWYFRVDGLLTVYSLRRGGATWDFLQHQSMERTLLRGRWSSTSTARIYLQDAVATVSHLQLTAEQRHLAHCAAARLKT